ncbi:hypothetical protein ACFQ08_28530 [Streptosporangium algeriense]|uniref:Energy transducer TonB n=1 Tax=Streptosporangium algeriense TaxID=1682748 RepID=A0ABW3DXG2_9ACTN
MNEKHIAESAEEAPYQQVRLVVIGAAFGALMLGASLAVALSGSSAPEMPRLPAMPNSSSLPIPSILPTFLPKDFPTALPSLPPDLRIPDFVLEKAP